MRKQQKRTMVLAMITVFMGTAIFLPGLVSAGDLEPPGPPGSTMKTLDQIPPTWSQILPASERFELVMGGDAVLDKETGLVWAKNANMAQETKIWQYAINYCRNLNIGGRIGWRLPTVEELSSLVDKSQTGPALPDGHPFYNVQSDRYWSSTTYEGDSGYAWNVSMLNGNVLFNNKSLYYYVWPVRGGN